MRACSRHVRLPRPDRTRPRRPALTDSTKISAPSGGGIGQVAYAGTSPGEVAGRFEHEAPTGLGGRP